MTIVYDWPLVTKAGPIDAAHIAPWAHLQTAAPDRLVAVPGNPFTGRFSGRLTVKAGDQPQSSSGWRAEVFTGANGKGIIPLDVLAFHGWAFTPWSWSDAWTNVGGQLHGAVPNAQPCFQTKIDHGGGFYVQVNWPGGGKWERQLLASVEPGMLPRIAFALRPSLGPTGFVDVEWAVGEEGEWSNLDIDGKPLTYTGPVGFAATYPKGTAYGKAGGGNTPWVVDLHRTVINAESLGEVTGLLTVTAAPPDLPGDPCAPVKAQLAVALAERDAARAIALDLKGRIDRMVSIGQTGA